MQPEGYGSIPMDLHISQQGYHPYYRKGQEDNPGPPVVQTRILEMRKEKSRDAARSRRGKENYEFYELAKMLPLPGAITTQLDKASIIRLTISFLKLKEFTSHGDPPWRREGPSLKGLRSRSISSVAIDLFEQHQATHILQSLDGFAFALGADGRFLYVSETVSIYLGLSQVEMTGSSVFDYIHQQDQAEVADLLGINLCPSPSVTSPASVASDDGSSSTAGPSTPTGFDRPPPTMTLSGHTAHQGFQRSFCTRFKSTLTKRGCHFKTSGYRVVLVISHLRPQCSFSPTRKQSPSIMGLVGLAIALPPPSVNELRLEPDMFVTRLTFDFRISHCEPRISELLDYSAEEITGKSMYTLCHAQDAERIRKCHIDLIQKGQVMSGYYRLMNKNGGYTWLQSIATVICNAKNAEEETIICVNYVLSRMEYEHCVMDCSQLPSSREVRSDDPSSSERGTSPDQEGGRGSTSVGDVDPEHQTTSRSDCEAKDGGNDDQFDRVNDLGNEGKNKSTHPNSDMPSSLEDRRIRDYQGITYLISNHLPESGTMDVRPTNSSPAKDSTVDGSTSTRHRKRKQADSLSAEADSKSPRSRPGSSSSSLDVLPMDNPGYSLATEDVSEQNMTPPIDAMCAQQSQSHTVSSNEHNSSDKCDKGGVSRPWTRSPASSSTPASSYTPESNCNKGMNPGMSVRELEDAMNKHLPHNPPDSSNSPSDVLMLKSFAPTASSSPQPSTPSTRHSIQWIGGAPTALPATTLLRQIYVSRESVIRSGAHASRHGCYGDVQGTLPTPPGGQSETYSDAAQMMLQSKLSADAYGVISGFSPSVTSSAGGYVDSCNAMTPPSSVSPRDKFNAEVSAFNEAAAVAAAAAMPHMRHYVTTDPNPLQHLPLKPQLFVHPGNLDHSAYGHPQQTLSPDQHQLYHHASGFHLYHPTHGSSKPSLHSANGTSWFCQPHS